MEFNRVLNSAYHYNTLSHITRSKTNYLKTLRKTVYFSLRYNWCTINYIYLKGYFDKFTYQDNEFIYYPQSFLTPIGIPPPLPFSWRRKWQPIPVLLPGKSHGWREEPGRLQCRGSQRVGHDWVTSLSFFCKKIQLHFFKEARQFYHKYEIVLSTYYGSGIVLTICINCLRLL